MGTETRWQEILRLQAEIAERQARLAYLAKAGAAAGELRMEMIATALPPMQEQR